MMILKQIRIMTKMDMLKPKIENDLKMVDTTIRQYYGFTKGEKQK